MSRTVHCVPSRDAEFCRAADAALAAIDATVEPEGIERMLAELLRPTYPLVAVHRQTELARVFDQEVWYAYRDGRPTHGTDADPD